MFKKLFVSIAMIASASSALAAEELSLVCVRVSDEGMEGLRLIVAEDQPIVALRKSSESSRVIRTGTYAVIMPDFVGNTGFRTLVRRQFRLTPVDSYNYQFEEVSEAAIYPMPYDCSVNIDAFPNPAMSISN